MNPHGTLVAESLKLGSSVDVPLSIRKVLRDDLGDSALGQPRNWTLLEFEVSPAHLDGLVRSLSDALEPTLGWYCDLHTDDETVVVFAAKVFRYARGDHNSRADAVGYARAMGVPDSQIDWPE